MHNHEPKDYICPLCQISRGEQTDRGSQEQDVVYRDTDLTAFIAAKWWPENSGNVIIIPNRHIENLYDLPEELGHKIFSLSKRVAMGLKETYQCDGVSTRQHNEPAGNQDVFHYHFHVLPRYENDNLYVRHEESRWVRPEERKPYADKLKEYLSNH